ncbi:MAG: MgtC/SapB family protein [Candidatus Obscuribacterales bacterium]|nr:MgtC/SapB family protein [Candidatus Obscuribacterales bacterium]
MGFLEQLISLTNYDWVVWFPLKLFLAFFLGALLGAERTTRQPVAGVRTHMILSASSCLISACGADLIHGAAIGSGDATRLAGQILAGIGFIGAGVIISRGVGVMTTAATIFFAAGLGIACGLGFFGFAIISTITIIVGLRLSEHWFPQEELPGKDLRVCCPKDKVEAVKKLLPTCVRLNSVVKHPDRIEMHMHFSDLSWAELDKLLGSIIDNPDVLSIQLLGEKSGL